MPDVLKPDEQAIRDYRIYESIWRNMDRENQLVNNRITWAIVLTGGLLTATVVLVGVVTAFHAHSAIGPAASTLSALAMLGMAVLAAVGHHFSVMSQRGVDAAFGQIEELKDQYYVGGVPNVSSRFENNYGLPRPFGNSAHHKGGSDAAKTFPSIMKWFWGAAGVIELIIALGFFVRALQG